MHCLHSTGTGKLTGEYIRDMLCLRKGGVFGLIARRTPSWLSHPPLISAAGRQVEGRLWLRALFVRGLEIERFISGLSVPRPGTEAFKSTSWG